MTEGVAIESHPQPEARQTTTTTTNPIVVVWCKYYDEVHRVVEDNILIESIVHHSQPTFLNLSTQEMPPRHWPKSDSLPTTNSLLQSGSCPAGLGGYLPDNLQFRASTNLLEHLAAIITPWIDIIAGRLKKGDCALSMTDSTTSEGWLWKSNFIEDDEDPIQATIQVEVAHLHATHYLLNEIREYNQWFRGANNNVADALSRDNDRTDDKLTQILRSHCPYQLPQHFEIVPLPNEIVSWLTSLLLRLPAKQQLAETHSATKLGRGTATQSIAEASDLATTFSSKTYPKPTESKSSELSPWLCVKGDFFDHMILPWLKAQSQIPSTMWLRSSGKMGTTTPNGMLSAMLHNFYGIS